MACSTLPAPAQSAGTLRPIRQFYAPMVPKDSFKRPVPDMRHCPLMTYKPPSSFPFELHLQGPFRDVPTGMLGQFEFCKYILQLSKGRTDAWVIQEIEYVQQSLSLHTCLRVDHDLEIGRHKPVPVEPDLKAKASASDFDWSYFDCSLLAPQKPLQKEIVEDKVWEDVMSEFGEFTDSCPSDPDADEGLLPEFTSKRKAKDSSRPDPPKSAKTCDAGSDARSEAGSLGSRVGQIKTVATDKDILQSSLEAIGRPVFRFGKAGSEFGIEMSLSF